MKPNNEIGVEGHCYFHYLCYIGMNLKNLVILVDVHFLCFAIQLTGFYDCV